MKYNYTGAHGELGFCLVRARLSQVSIVSQRETVDTRLEGGHPPLESVNAHHSRSPKHLGTTYFMDQMLAFSVKSMGITYHFTVQSIHVYFRTNLLQLAEVQELIGR